MGNLQNHTVQCVLVINIFNEKIFIFLWFWFMALMLLTTISFLYWFSIMVLPWFNRWFISRHLELSEMPFDPKGSAKDVERFVASYLKTDGVFVLRMITMHSGIIFGTELVLSLWRSFYGIESQIRRGDSDPAYLTPTPTSPGEDTGPILNALRQRSMAKDALLAKEKDKSKDDSVLKEPKSKLLEDLPEEDPVGTGLTEVLLKGPARRTSGVTRRNRPSAPAKSLDLPDSRVTTLEAGKGAVPARGAELRIDMGDVDDDVETDNEDDDDDVLLQQQLQSRKVRLGDDSDPTVSNVKNTARGLEKYLAAKGP